MGMFQKGKKISQNIYAMSSDSHSGGVNHIDWLNSSLIGLERWKPKGGENLVDIIPYNATASHPFVIKGLCQVGDPLYNLDIMVHTNIGMPEGDYVCLKNYGQDCPMCRESSRLWNNGNQEMSGKIRAKRRIVYVLHDLKENKYGYWNTGWKSVEEQVMKEAAFEVDENGNKIDVMDWEEGRTIEFQGSEETFNGNKYFKPERFRFRKRQPLSDEVLSHSVDISKAIINVTAEQMENILAGKLVPQQTNSQQETVQQASAVNMQPQPVPETSSTSQLAQEAAPSVAPQPVQQEAAPAQAQAAPAQPAPTQPSSDPAKVCPFGHKFGVDVDAFGECTTCDCWEKCVEG